MQHGRGLPLKAFVVTAVAEASDSDCSDSSGSGGRQRKKTKKKKNKETNKEERKNNVGACLHCVAVDGLRGGTSLGSGALAQGSGALAQGSGALAQGPGQKGESRHDDMKSFGCIRPRLVCCLLIRAQF